MPVPDSITLWYLPLPSVIKILAVLLPLADGAKVTVMKQLAPAAKELLQILVSPKSLPLVSAIEMLLRITALVLVLVSLTLRGALLAPIGCSPKLTLVGVN